MSSSNKLTKQAAVDGAAMNEVLVVKISATQNLVVEYLPFQLGDLAL